MIKNYLKKLFARAVDTLANKAVNYAESLLGEGCGAHKKQIAINFILDRLPLWLKPFKGLIGSALDDILDNAIEAAVVQLKGYQEALKYSKH